MKKLKYFQFNFIQELMDKSDSKPCSFLTAKSSINSQKLHEIRENRIEKPGRIDSIKILSQGFEKIDL